MRKIFKTLTLIMAMMLVLTVPVMAAPADDSDVTEESVEDTNTDNAVSNEAEASADDQEEIVEEPEDESVGTVDDKNNGYVFKRFDDMGEFVVESSKSDFNCSQLNVSCVIPDGFTLGVILEIENETEGLKFRLVSTATNGYSTRMHVPAGSYHVLNCYVDGDSAMDYPMSLPNDFTLDKNQVLTLESTLRNYGEIEDEANKRMHPEEYSEKSEESEVPADPNVKIVPWRRVEHIGSGQGIITITDNSEKGCAVPIDFILKITAPGGERRGEYVYSTDGGITWTDTRVITTSFPVSIITTDSHKDTGLTFYFNSKKFEEGDEFRFSSVVEYGLKTETSNGGGRIRITSPDVIYNDSYKLDVMIVQTGELGTALFKYSVDGGKHWVDDITVPEDGVYDIPNTPLSITFWLRTEEDKIFMVNDEYSCNIKGDMSKRSMAPLFIGIVMVLLLTVFIIVIALRSKRSKPWEYTLNVYKPVELKKRKK